MAKYKVYWYGISLKMIKMYPVIKKRERSEQEEKFLIAIEKAIEETKSLHPDDYGCRLAAVDLIYFKKTHKANGIKDKVHASERTIYRWLNDFVVLTGRIAGF